MIETRTVETNTLKGLKRAERMHTSGVWKQVAVTPFAITFARSVPAPVKARARRPGMPAEKDPTCIFCDSGEPHEH